MDDADRLTLLRPVLITRDRLAALQGVLNGRAGLLQLGAVLTEDDAERLLATALVGLIHEGKA